MSVKLVHITPDSEKLIAYCARVSSPNPENPEIEKLLSYCTKHGHWSIFEMANMCVEIETGRDIAPQILRHRSFSFQEFSQRYAAASSFVKRKARRQDNKNRQNSLDDLSDADKSWFDAAQQKTWSESYELYEEALKRGIAKECARAMLPMNTQTKLYMNGSIRSWIHYLNVRCDPATQLEHREIANAIKDIFIEQLPVISRALSWTNSQTS